MSLATEINETPQEFKTPLYMRKAVLKYQSANKDKINEKSKRYRDNHKDDPEYLERRRAAQRAYKQRIKEKKIQNAATEQNDEEKCGSLAKSQCCPFCMKKLNKSKKLKCI